MSKQKHSMTGTPIYVAWLNMKARCNNQNNPSYKDYGARGIKVCREWQEFTNFRDDMLPLYRDGLTLERIDVNGNYSKENCTWTNRYNQAINRRNTKLINLNGKSLTLTDWAKVLGKKRSTLSQRYYVYGWSVEDTLLR